MPAYVSMLRGINVGSQKRIKMLDLKELYQSLNLKDVKTYIQSGNIVFNDEYSSPTELVYKIEKEIKKIFGVDVKVFIKTKNEFQEIIENNPFPQEDINNLYVTFLSKTPAEYPLDEINKRSDKSEKFSISLKEIYLCFHHGYGKTKLSNDFFEKKLKVSATTRNWKTVNKLLELARTIS